MARRYRALTVVLGAARSVTTMACSDDSESAGTDYESPTAISEALRNGGVDCDFRPVPAREAALFDAQASGQCEGSDFVVHIFVMDSEAKRVERQNAALRHWCDAGLSSGSYVSAGRWLVTLEAPPTDDPDAVYMSDLAEATGGIRTPLRCT